MENQTMGTAPITLKPYEAGEKRPYNRLLEAEDGKHEHFVLVGRNGSLRVPTEFEAQLDLEGNTELDIATPEGTTIYRARINKGKVEQENHAPARYIAALIYDGKNAVISFKDTQAAASRLENIASAQDISKARKGMLGSIAATKNHLTPMGRYMLARHVSEARSNWC